MNSTFSFLPLGFPTEILYAFQICVLHATCLVYLIPSDLVILIIFCEEGGLRKSLCSPFHCSVTFPVIGPDAHMSVCPDAHMSVFPDAHMSVFPDAHMSVFPDAHMSACPDAHISVFPDAHISVFPDAHMSACPDAHISVFPKALSLCSFLQFQNLRLDA
jgi:hypothetical protein